MGDLKDQLLKAGLVTEEQLHKASQPPRKRRSKGRRPAQKAREPGSDRRSTEEIDLSEAYKLRAREERQAREEAARKRREEERQRKANRARIATLIREHSQNDEAADRIYNFAVSDKVKQVRVTHDQLQALAKGELAITFLEGRRHLVPAAIADQIQSLDPGKLVVRHDPDATRDEESDIPDDLMW